ncbi:MAG: flagella protein [Methanosarcinales archaeon]|nr:flagella protein [Methanosarcinales archaeon]
MSGIFDKLKKITNKKGSTKNSGGDDGSSPFGAPPGLDNVPDFGTPSPFGDVPDIGGPPVASPPFGEGSPPVDGAPGFPPMGAPAQPPQDSELSKENSGKISDLKDQVAKMGVSIAGVERSNTELSETVKKIDESVLELLSLYEMVSNQVNPFVGDGGADSESIERFDKIEKRLNAFGEMTAMLKNELDAVGLQHVEGMSEKSAEILQSMEETFESFGQSIVVIHEDIADISMRVKDIEEMNIEEVVRNNVAEAVKLAFDEIGPIVAEVSEEESQVVDAAGEQHIEKATKGLEENTSSARLKKLDNNPMTAIVLLNWIEFLMERVGRNNLMEALDYYIDIGWISEDVRNEILAYARGIDYYVEKPTWRLLPEDHTKSLIFIERLMGRKIDRTQLNTVEREMSKVKHSMEELYGI